MPKRVNLPPGKPSNTTRNRLWNQLTGLVLILISGTIFVYALIYFNPETGINPYPPPTLPPLAEYPNLDRTTKTLQTITQLEQTNTPTPTLMNLIIKSTSEEKPLPTTKVMDEEILYTPTSEADIVLITPIIGELDPLEYFHTPTATPRTMYIYPFVLQGEPQGVKVSTIDPNIDCSWFGVGGQIVNIQGRPVNDVTVQLGGLLENRKIEPITTLSGTSSLFGQGGYEIKISDGPIESYLSLWVRLLDQSGEDISARTHFSTYASCSHNLVVINFKQKR